MQHRQRGFGERIGDDDKNISNVSGLVTTTVFNTKNGEVENKIPAHAKYITSLEFVEFAA